jgi:diguanylate cyclase (GGDEF)-like protein
VAAISQRMINRFSPTILVAGFLLLAHLVLLLLVRDAGMRSQCLGLGRPFWALVAAGALFTAAWQLRVTARRMALAWFLLGMAEVSLAVSALIAMWQQSQRAVVAFPSLADVFQLIAYPLLVTVLFLLPIQRLTQSEQRKVTLDLIVVLLSAMQIFWVGWLGLPTALISQQSWLVQLVVMIYLTEALVLVAAFVILLFHRTEVLERRGLALLAAGIGALLVANWNYGVQSLLDQYRPGGWLDLGWVISSLFFAVVGVWQAASASSIGANPINKGLSIKRWESNTWIAYLPYALPLLVFAVMEFTPQHSELAKKYEWLKWLTGLTLTLMFVRQVITLRENNRFVVRLRQQAMMLYQTNYQLQLEIGERKQAEARLAHDALHDALTGLPNRVLFLDRLHLALQRAKANPHYRFAVLFLDLDHFKAVNDSLGHTAGDQLLTAIAQRLQLCAGASDTVARLSGDEFVILLETGEEGQDAQTVAECILAQFKLAFELGEHQHFAAVSIGIVIDAHLYDRPDDVIRDADIAMYYAKLQGKGRYACFTASMRQEVLWRIELENDLKAALERQEFELYYQPIVSLSTEQIVGFEALIRWHHPKRGLVSPAEFIPIAEESGLIVPIGEWVLVTACRQLKEWQNQFSQQPPLMMSVNISAKQFAEPGFIQVVEQTLSELALEPNTVRLEITEGAWLTSSPEAIALFHQLHALGVQVDIDDFGTGYSSLSYLHDFPIQSIKIARAFVEQMDKGLRNGELIRGIITMAHDLGMDAIAEGVETVEQLNKLKALGCNYGQGYLLSRPVARAAAEQLLTQPQSAPSHPTAPQSRPQEQLAV